jgi:hypothetical protein
MTRTAKRVGTKSKRFKNQPNNIFYKVKIKVGRTSFSEDPTEIISGSEWRMIRRQIRSLQKDDV